MPRYWWCCVTDGRKSRPAPGAINQLTNKCQEGMFWSCSKSKNVELSSYLERCCSVTFACLNLCFWWCTLFLRPGTNICFDFVTLFSQPAQTLLCTASEMVVFRWGSNPAFGICFLVRKNRNRLGIPWWNASRLQERLFAGICYCLSAKDRFISFSLKIDYFDVYLLKGHKPLSLMICSIWQIWSRAPCIPQQVPLWKGAEVVLSFSWKAWCSSGSFRENFQPF